MSGETPAACAIGFAASLTPLPAADATLLRAEKPPPMIPPTAEVSSQNVSRVAIPHVMVPAAFLHQGPPPLIVTEHRAHGCRCAACGSQTRAAFPQAVDSVGRVSLVRVDSVHIGSWLRDFRTRPWERSRPREDRLKNSVR
jgi:hypothetical protein